MTIQQTRWTPDTCPGCEVVYSWDDSLPAEQRIHTMTEVHSRCSFHQAILDSSLYQTLFTESNNLQKVYEAAERRGLSRDDITSLIAEYNAGRTIIVRIKLNQNQRNNLQAELDTLLGVGRAIVQAL